jgi:glutamine synthetase adenylyltransferase
MANDAQTHSLPRDENELAVLARTLGYSTADNFLKDYERHTRTVKHIFDAFFSETAGRLATSVNKTE